MRILIHRTYEIITPESAEHGEAEERGFLSEGEEVNFRELADLIEDHPYASCSHVGPRSWFTSGPDEDYRTGDVRYTSIHLANPDDPRQARYWRLAIRYRERVLARRYLGETVAEERA
jgi:hypothetical protein